MLGIESLPCYVNMKERKALGTIQELADKLLYGPASANLTITNMDVMEAILGDIRLVAAGREPTHLQSLVDIDSRLA